MGIPSEEHNELGTLSVLYEETLRTIDRQFESIESLTNRAATLLGFAAVIVSVLGTLSAKDSSCAIKALAIADAGLFTAGAALCFAAWRFREYRDDPHVEQLYGTYRHTEEQVVRDQIIGNRHDSIRQNAATIQRKGELVRDAAWVLAAGFLVLVALVIVRLFV